MATRVGGAGNSQYAVGAEAGKAAGKALGQVAGEAIGKAAAAKSEKGILEKIADSPVTGVLFTTAAGTAAAVATAGGGALLAATPIGWGLMAAGAAAAYLAWSND